LAASFGQARVQTTTAGQKPELEPVRRLVEMLNGNWQPIEFKDSGCTCRFDFPAGVEKVLLVVEDNEGVIQAFQRYLAGYNYQVVGATTGSEALRLAREMSPTMITLDVMIPGQDGWEILHSLKRDPATQPIPVIICSVLEDPELARSLGAAAYLRKPVAQADLLATLERISGAS
jgi:CheY-like chemotaxis protein